MKSEEAVSDSGSDRENKPLPTTGENNSHCKKEEDVVKPKRKYSGWSVEEVDAFFIGIATHGCDFEKLTKVPLLNKNYEQIRHYYYRLIKRMNAALSGVGKQINKGDKVEVREALICYYQELKKTGNGDRSSPPRKGSFEKDLADALLKVLQPKPKLPQPTQPCKILPSPVISVTPKTANQNVRVVNPTKPLPKRLTLQLIPLDPTIANAISRHGHNPYLQLTYSPKKSISYIVKHMTNKWVFDLNGTKVSIAPKPIRLYPTDVIQHPGWGAEDSIGSAQVWTMLGYPAVMRLFYTWNLRADTVSFMVPTYSPLLQQPHPQQHPPQQKLSTQVPKPVLSQQRQPLSGAPSVSLLSAPSTFATSTTTTPTTTTTVTSPPSDGDAASPTSLSNSNHKHTQDSQHSQEELLGAASNISASATQLDSPAKNPTIGGDKTTTTTTTTTPTKEGGGVVVDFSGIELPEIRFTSSSNDGVSLDAFPPGTFSPSGGSPTTTPLRRDNKPSLASTTTVTPTSSAMIMHAGSPSPTTTSTSPKFLKTPETPCVLSLSFLGDDASRDGFKSLGDTEEKECHEYYQEFESASRDSSSNFEKFFREHLSNNGGSTPSPFVGKRLDFGLPLEEERKRGIGLMTPTATVTPNALKRRFHETLSPSPKDTTAPHNLLNPTTTTTTHNNGTNHFPFPTNNNTHNNANGNPTKRKRLGSFSPPSALRSAKDSEMQHLNASDVPSSYVDLLGEETNSNSTWSWLEKIL